MKLDDIQQSNRMRQYEENHKKIKSTNKTNRKIHNADYLKYKEAVKTHDKMGRIKFIVNLLLLSMLIISLGIFFYYPQWIHILSLTFILSCTLYLFSNRLNKKLSNVPTQPENPIELKLPQPPKAPKSKRIIHDAHAFAIYNKEFNDHILKYGLILPDQPSP